MQKFLASLALVVCLAGCANRDPKIITRRDPAYFPAATNRLALSSHGQSRAEDEVLRAALRSELTRRGFHLTTATNADFVLAYWIQDDWNSMHPGGWHVGAGNFAPVGNITYENSPVTAPGSLTVGVTSDGRLERYMAYQSICLELYPQDKLRTGNLSPAWTGSIEAGITAKPEMQPALLRALLEHFGQDYVGRAKLP